MSHLLTRLVDRAMGVNPAIEPVRLPIFGAAPVAGFEQDSGREPAGFAYADIITAAQRMHPTGIQTSAEHAQQEIAPHSPVQPAAKQVLDGFTNDHPVAQNPLQARGNEPADHSAARVSPARLIESVVVEPRPSATVVSPVTPQTPRSSDSLSPRDEQLSKAVDRISGPQASPNSSKQTRVESLLRPQVFTVPPVSSMNMVDQIPQQIINSRVEQPTIKVTIGRIDVRAITTPPVQAPRQRNKTQPSLSLDDYLKQRTGGH